MKAAAAFAFRVLVLTVALIVIFMIAINVTGMNRTPVVAQQMIPGQQASASTTSQAQQAASTLPPLLAYTFLISLVIAWILQNSRWRGAKLTIALVFTFYGLMTFITQIESLVYLRAKMPSGLITKLFIMGAVVAVLYVPVAVLIMGKIRGKEEAPQVEGELTPASKIVRLAIVATLYVVLYYLFGHYVAWQNPEVRLYYSGSTETTTFFRQIRSIWSSIPWMFPFQFGRGLFWALFAYPAIRMMKTSRLETACTIAALFGVWSFVLLMPNPLMPASVAHSHFWETLWCDVLLGAVVGWILSASARAGKLTQKASAAVS